MAIVIVLVVVAAGVGVYLLRAQSLPSGSYPTVQVSGKFSPPNKVDIGPTSVSFVNTLTKQQYSANATNGQYSVQLPNPASYNVTVTWTMFPGGQNGTSNSGTLNLNASAQTYNFDVSW